MKLIESLAYTPVELAFGTSGLRGLVSDMTDLECFINSAGALRFLAEQDGLKPGDAVFLGGDLRDSTPRIMHTVAAAITDGGYQVINCGLVPTPALAYYALQHDGPAIMVTGSHIPADRNGIKYYKRAGEVLKEDEAPIKAAVAAVRAKLYAQDAVGAAFDERGAMKQAPELPATVAAAATDYLKRYTDVFAADSLAGAHIVVYQQSSVGRDLLVTLLEKLGARVTPIERSDVFIPIDTENITPEEKDRFRGFAKKYPDAFAIVSADGDCDRPIVVDERGEFQRGDMLNCVTARLVGAKSVAVPLSANDALDKVCADDRIKLTKTKVGSPYVIVAMQQAAARPSVSWEVNGGFLTNDDIRLGGGVLKALPTRDAVLPILANLVMARRQKQSLSALFSSLPQRSTGAGLIDNMPEAELKQFRELVSDQKAMRQLAERVFAGSDLGNIAEVNVMDGLRLRFESGDVVHFRPSSNAPQFRVYTNAASQARADDLVARAIAPDGYIVQLLSGLTAL